MVNNDEWKKKLDPEAYAVLREKATEPAFSGELYTYKKDGMYVCGACGEALFSSDQKYDSGSGWPSFTQAVSDDAVATEDDTSFGMKRVEIICRKCGSHLGHMFDDGPTQLNGKPSTGKRFCVNSKSLMFKGSDGSTQKG